jgi:hypothetical protein
MTQKEKQAKRKQALEQLETLFDDKFSLYIRDVIRDFQGQFPVLESALGALIMGRVVGWRVLFLIHSRATVAKYEKVLGLKFRGKAPWNSNQDVMPEVGPFAEKSYAYTFSESVNEFWEIIKSETKMVRSDKEKLDSVV